MQLSALILSVMASLAMAVPTNTGGGGDGGGGDGGGSSDYDPCTATALINAQAQCCSADVGGIADLTCKTVPETPKNADDFKSICAESGQTAMCCTLSVLGISVLCATPIGV